MNLPTYMSGILFTKAHKLVRTQFYEVLEKYDLNPTYWSILEVTAQAPEGIRLSGVASLLGVKAPTVTTEAEELVNRGLILRIPHHTDGRAKLLVLTPKGKKLATKVEKEIGAEIERLLSGLTADEVTGFQKTLQTIISNSQK